MHLCNAGLALTLLATTTFAADHSLGEAGKVPEGPSEAVAKTLDAKGLAIKAGETVVANVWFVKQPALAANPGSFTANYRFANGQLIGVLQVTGKGEFGDFRDQAVKAGVYTLRYGLQPEDGNHIGTSDTTDFLLALPVEFDKTPAALDFTKLTSTSAKSVSSSHPAIFSMLVPGKPAEKPAIEKQGQFHVLRVPVVGKQGDKEATVDLRVVVVGHGDE